tara:strand:- start:179 stop:520 length:342 start_codon:yes stop_codon:yes gene_type:complete
MKDYIMKNKTIFKPSGEKITNFNDLSIVLDYIKNHGTNDTMNMMIYAIKDRRTALSREIKSSLSVNDKVIVKTRFALEPGTITKVMKTRCAVKFDSNSLTYACPMNIVEKRVA